MRVHVATAARWALAPGAWALSAAALAAEVDWKGTLEANLHFGLDGCAPATLADCRWLDFQDLVVAGVQADGEVGEAVRFRVDGRLRLHPIGDAAEVVDTELGNRVQPFTVDVPDAWIELRELIGTAVDLRVGQQTFAWGAGLGVHPTDVANPFDLRDPTRFDRRLGTAAVAGRIHKGDALVELVWTPLFRPARMPAEVDLLADADALFDFSDVGGGEVEIGEFETRTTMPDGRVGFAGVGGRFSLASPVADVSVIAWRGHDSLPQAGGEARLVGFQTDAGRVDVGIPIVYPPVFVAGGDVYTALPGEIGAWIEGVVVFPQRVTVTAARAQLEALVRIGTIDAMPDPLPETVTQDGRPYPRLVAGLDRTFGRVMLAAQWIHGLPTERSVADIGDYGLVAMGWSISEVSRLDVRALSDGRGGLVGADLSVLHRDAATLRLGLTLARGPAGTALGDLQGLSNLSLGVEAAL